jgi:hypothetical protein
MLKHPSTCNTSIDDDEDRATAENREMSFLLGGYQLRVRSWSLMRKRACGERSGMAGGLREQSIRV